MLCGAESGDAGTFSTGVADGEPHEPINTTSIRSKDPHGLERVSAFAYDMILRFGLLNVLEFNKHSVVR